MKKNMKSIACALIVILVVSLCPKIHVKADAATQDGNAMSFRELTSDQLTAEMGAGWNLGNTMDGHTGFTPSETIWQGVKTTKALIKSVHDMGFNTVRIPVTWGTMIDEENGYAIDEAWISRVQDIVDYCEAMDMYAIINIHHDGAEQTGWLRIASDDFDSVKEEYAAVWKNIATRFKDYDEHLIFESMNEVKGEDMTVVEENQNIMALNQIFVDTVRATGSNNSKRWLVVTGKYNYIDSVCNEKNEFALPADTVENRLIVSVHDYTPWTFCGMEGTATTEYTLEGLQSNQKELQPLYDTYTSKGIPVIVGEYGCINKDNAQERAYYLEGMNRIFSQYNLIGIYWDQGWYDRSESPDYSFSVIDRMTGASIDKEVTDAMMRGRFLDGAEDLSDITKSPEVESYTAIILNQSTLTMAVGDEQQVTVTTEPASSNDIVLYKSSDETVATVAYGKIIARGAGTATITAFAQSGSTEATIEVTVNDKAGSVPCTNLIVTNETYDLSAGEYEYIGATMEPETTDETLYYRSSDEAVVTVSKIGKILTIGEGTATVTVYTTGGMKKEITVNVVKEEAVHEIQLALNVYYNDSANNYFSNEVASDVITVNQDGQYTLTFDCETDLSDAAKAAGVTGLNALSAIYIKDNLVTQGTTQTTPLTSCDITYDSIIVDGTPMTITKEDAKSALKASGVFDTNDPINAWDGSVIEEVNGGNFTTIENPQKIEVTFTLSGMVYEDGTVADGKVQETEAPSVEPTIIATQDTDKAANTTNTDEKSTSNLPLIAIAVGFVIVFVVVVVVRIKNKK